MTIEEMRERLVDLFNQSEALQKTAEAEKRDFTDDERKQLDTLDLEMKQVEGDMARLESLCERAARLQASVGRKADPEDVASARKAPALPINAKDRGTFGFYSFGDFALAVKRASAKAGPAIDPRLISNAPTSFGQEGVGEDGGFLIPPDFRQEIMTKITGEDSLLGRTDQQFSSSNTWSQPVDETTPWQTSGGIQAYWEGEAAQFTQSKPNFRDNALRLHKLTALIGVTEELREDAPSIDRYLRSKAPQKMNFKIADAIINGDGVGKPLGIMNSPALVTVAKETSQAADTFRVENVTKMWGRMYAPYRASAVWLVNQDLEQQLLRMGAIVTTPDGTTAVGGAGLVYLPPGGLSASPYGTLLGRPVIVTEACAAIGDLGDVIFASLPEYVTVTKVAGIRADVSIHLWFDYDMAAYKFVFRLAGHPWLSAPITRKNGSNTLSSFVTLAAR